MVQTKIFYLYQNAYSQCCSIEILTKIKDKKLTAWPQQLPTPYNKAITQIVHEFQQAHQFRPRTIQSQTSAVWEVALQIKTSILSSCELSGTKFSVQQLVCLALYLGINVGPKITRQIVGDRESVLTLLLVTIDITIDDTI